MTQTVSGCPFSCPAGAYGQGGEGAVLRNYTFGDVVGCIGCPQGAICPSEATPAPQWCHPGHYMPYNASAESECRKAALGQYQDEHNATATKTCEAGRFSATEAQSTCEFCAAGGYCSDPGASSA